MRSRLEACMRESSSVFNSMLIICMHVRVWHLRARVLAITVLA